MQKNYKREALFQAYRDIKRMADERKVQVELSSLNDIEEIGSLTGHQIDALVTIIRPYDEALALFLYNDLYERMGRLKDDLIARDVMQHEKERPNNEH